MPNNLVRSSMTSAYRNWLKHYIVSPIFGPRNSRTQISIQTKDFWSAQFIVVPMLAFLAFLFTNRTDDPVWSPLFVVAIGVMTALGMLWSVFEIACSRPRRAMSLLAGTILMGASTYYCSNIILQNRLVALSIIVEKQRALLQDFKSDTASNSSNNVRAPLRMVVFPGNWHGNSSRNGEFEYVVFDETDQVARHPEKLSEFLPYPGSNFVAIDKDANKKVEKLADHYYRVTETR